MGLINLKAIEKMAAPVSKELKNFSSVPTSLVAKGEVDVWGGLMKEKMLKSPAADKFIRSCEKQNSQIIGDSVLLYDDIPYRAVTKRLPSKSTITELYDMKGQKIAKGVKTKKQKAISAYQDGDFCATVVEDGRRVIMSKNGNDDDFWAYGMDRLLKSKAECVGDICVALANREKIMRFANENNQVYNTLRQMGLIR